MKPIKEKYIWAILRLSIGFIFLWSFFDKVFGLGFNTTADKAWVAGNSPTYGFLKFGTRGPLAEFFQSLAGSAVVDWLFMIGLIFVGLTLMLGIMVRLGSLIGALMLFLMYLALIPPEHNPFLDDHIIYAIVLLGLAMIGNDGCCGLGKKWSDLQLAKRYPILK
jgi:thiosulfate dehydrogenase [quinone] large subunit